MPKRNRALLLKSLALIAGGLIVWKLGASWLGEAQGTERLVNQVWIERAPASERDLIRYFFLIEHDDHRHGIAGRGSRWRTVQDGFVWGLEGDRLRTRFPQNDRRLQLQARTWDCGGQAPRPFELCLELRRAGGQSKKFFSRKEWVIQPHGDLPADIAWLAIDRRPPSPADAALLDEGADTEGDDDPNAAPDAAFDF